MPMKKILSTLIISWSLLASITLVALSEEVIYLPIITNSVGVSSRRFDWLDWNATQLTGKFIGLPERAQIPENIREQLIVVAQAAEAQIKIKIIATIRLVISRLL